jgi:hypothetical protein
MAGEEWARRIVEKELGRTVVINDDGSAPSMYDLRVGPPDAPEVAIECVGAVDQTYTETWNVGPAKGSLQLSISGDWIVEIAPAARVKTVKQHLEQLLQGLEARGIYKVDVDWELEWNDPVLFNNLNSINITHASCYTQQGTGKVYLTMPGNGGAVDEHGIAVPGWVGEFLRDSARQDVLSKLERSGAPHRHAFLIVTFTGATWAVESYLSGNLEHLPSHAPDLPVPVTGVWVVSRMGQRGLRWDEDTWKLFETRGEGIED